MRFTSGDVRDHIVSSKIDQGLPHPVSSTHVQSAAETILSTANDGEPDPTVLERMALLELQICPDS